MRKKNKVNRANRLGLKGEIAENARNEILDKIDNIDQINYKVFSQNGEDGIIQYLIKSLKLNHIKFVEIGTQDYTESNTRFIFETMRCDGLIIDPLKNLETLVRKNVSRFWKNNLTVINKFA